MSGEIERSRMELPALPRDMRVATRTRVTAITVAWLVGAFGVIYVPVVGSYLPPLMLLVMLAFVWGLMRTAKMWGTTIMDAEAHLRANELDAADALYKQAPGRTWWPVYRVISMHYRSVINRMRGELPLTVAALESLIASGWLQARTGTLAFLSPDTYGEAALTYALLGDIARAEALLEEARGRLSPIRRALIALPEAVLRARRGEWDACIDNVEEDRERARGLLRPHDMRALAIIEAYALTRASTQAYREPSRSRRPEHALAEARPARPGEYAYLSHAWPELHEFTSASLP